MSESTEQILDWIHEVENYQATEWERLPEIYLYMDQVLTYMDKQLHLFERDEKTSLLTSSMVNNYVKDGVLPRPEQKKYSRDHLAMLTVICMLKQVLSIPDISFMMKSLLENSAKSEMYERFRSAQASALKDVCERVEASATSGEGSLQRLAIELAIEASARRAAAERILSELAKPGEEDPPKKEKK